MNECFVLGILPLSSTYAAVLFDWGATHSFVSTDFVREFNLNIETGNEEWNMHTQTRNTKVTNLIYKSCTPKIGAWHLQTNLIVLEMKDFDALFGMN